MQGVAAKNDASYDLSRARASVTGQTTIAASLTELAGLVMVAERWQCAAHQIRALIPGSPSPACRSREAQVIYLENAERILVISPHWIISKGVRLACQKKRGK